MMVDSVQRAAPTPQSSPSLAGASAGATAANRYAAGWNPPAPPPPPPPPPPEPRGFLDRLGSAISNGDVRDVASTVRDGIGDATEAGRNGITSAVNWTGSQIGNAADAARSHITGDDILSQGLRNAIGNAESITRFQVGFTGGVLREGVGLLGTVGQLGVTASELQVSAEARQELASNVVGAVGNAADATGRYLESAVQDPSRIGADVSRAWDATTDAVGGTLDRYGQAIAEGRTEEIGMDVGTVATYVVPVGGGPARGLLTAGMRGAAREGAEVVGSTVARDVTRQVANDLAPPLRAANDAAPSLRGPLTDTVAPPPPPGARGLAAPDVPPSPLHAKAQMAEHVYGRGDLPPGVSTVTDAGELRALNLTPEMLDRGAFHAEVYRNGPAGSGDYTIAFRGSGPTRAGDWVSNGLQGLGLPSNHYARALEIGKSIARVDPSINVDFVGHSLGGGLASHAANAAGREATTFNAAGLHFISRLQGQAVARDAGITPGHATNYAVPGEILTTAQENLWPLTPRAFGETQRLPSVMPEGKTAWDHYGPLAPINRHQIDWVLASTAAR